MKEKIIPILNNEYKVVVCWGSPKQVEKVLKSWGHNVEDSLSSLINNSRGLTYYNNTCVPVIALRRKPKTREEIGTLAHEACHAIENIFGKISEPLGGEVFAHSVGAVVREGLK